MQLVELQVRNHFVRDVLHNESRRRLKSVGSADQQPLEMFAGAEESSRCRIETPLGGLW